MQQALYGWNITRMGLELLPHNGRKTVLRTIICTTRITTSHMVVRGREVVLLLRRCLCRTRPPPTTNRVTSVDCQVRSPVLALSCVHQSSCASTPLEFAACFFFCCFFFFAPLVFFVFPFETQFLGRTRPGIKMSFYYNWV